MLTRFQPCYRAISRSVTVLTMAIKLQGLIPIVLLKIHTNFVALIISYTTGYGHEIIYIYIKYLSISDRYRLSEDRSKALRIRVARTDILLYVAGITRKCRTTHFQTKKWTDILLYVAGITRKCRTTHFQTKK